MASKSRSSKTDASVKRANQNFDQFYGRIDSTLIGTTNLDQANKDLVAVTKDFNNLLLMSRRISDKEKVKAD